MNGEHQQILNAINTLDKRLSVSEALQEERHRENQKDMNCLGSITRAQEKHCHEIGKLKVHRAVHWVMLGAIAVAIILT